MFSSDNASTVQRLRTKNWKEQIISYSSNPDPFWEKKENADLLPPPPNRGQRFLRGQGEADYVRFLNNFEPSLVYVGFWKWCPIASARDQAS